MAAINSQLQQAIALARAGKGDEARTQTEQVLASEPKNTHALFLMSSLVRSSEEQVDYLQRIMDIDPDYGPARERLSQLQEQHAKVSEAADVEDEELPDTMIMEAPLFGESPDEVVKEQPVPTTDEPGDAEEEHHALFARTTSADEAEAAEINFSAMASEEVSGPESSQEGATGQAEGGSLLEQSEAGSVPDWLRDAGGYAERDAMADDEQPLETVASIEEEDDIPDWLQDEPEDDWLDQTLLDESDTWSEAPYEQPVEEMAETMPAGEATLDEPAEAYEPPATEGLDLEAELATASAAGEPAPTPPEQRRSRGSTRTYEIILLVLIILAIVVVAALAYVILVPPF